MENFGGTDFYDVRRNY